MKYVYGCPVDKSHPRQELTHGMTEIVSVPCSACGAQMHRIPQPFTWGHRPFDTLYHSLEAKYTANRARRNLNR